MRKLAILLASLAFWAAVPASAQVPPATSQALTKHGYWELQGNRYNEAIGWFRERLRVDKRDAGAVFLQGVALNRQGRHGSAARLFADYEKAGGTHKELDFEYGAALWFDGQKDAGRERLLRYKAANPAGAAKADGILAAQTPSGGTGFTAPPLTLMPLGPSIISEPTPADVLKQDIASGF
jgi:hypothetical protein